MHLSRLAALRGEPTGATREWRGDVVAVAKRALRAGEILDGEGGFTVWGKLAPARRSLEFGALPIGLAHAIVLRRDVAAGAMVTADDIAYDEANPALTVRREMERNA